MTEAITSNPVFPGNYKWIDEQAGVFQILGITYFAEAKREFYKTYFH